VVLGISKPCSEVVDGVLAGSDLSVQALGLDVDKVNAVLLAKVKVFKNRVILAETIAAFIKTDLHGISPLFIMCGPQAFRPADLFRLFFS
jgi:hypothetical protein